MTVKEEHTQENPHAALVSEMQCAPQRQDSQYNAAATLSILH